MPRRSRFAAAKVTPRTGTRAAPAPTGWVDNLPLPPAGERHMFLDTGIYHSLADSAAAVRPRLVPLLEGHEPNKTIAWEVRTQRHGALPSVSSDLLALLDSRARPGCRIQVPTKEVGAVRDELIADAQSRHGRLVSAQTARDAHGGEAELIYVASQHTPEGTVATNDAGASAVGARRDVASIHFVHVLRAAVAAGVLSIDEALRAADDGLQTAGLAVAERRRTANRDWLNN